MKNFPPHLSNNLYIKKIWNKIFNWGASIYNVIFGDLRFFFIAKNRTNSIDSNPFPLIFFIHYVIYGFSLTGIFFQKIHSNFRMILFSVLQKTFQEFVALSLFFFVYQTDLECRLRAKKKRITRGLLGLWEEKLSTAFIALN